MVAGQPAMDLYLQHITFFILSIAAALALGTLAALHPALFKQFLGPVHPLIAVGAAAVVGAIALQYLMHTEGFVIIDRKRVSGALLAASILGTGFGLAIIGVEIWFVRYPQDMNVALPEALLFYPGMGYLVEVGFHLVPLALLCALTRPLQRLLNPEFRLWFCIAAVAAIEPTFQFEIEAQPRAYTWFHVFAFNLAQLVLFRKFGFVAMFGMRLIYYLHWHLLWGCARLYLFF